MISTSSNRSLAHWRIVANGLIIALLAGCMAGTPTTPPKQDPSAQAVNINALLAKAQISQSPQRELLLLEAARHLQEEDQLSWARNLLNDIDPNLLNDAVFIEYTLSFSDIALADDAYFLAQRILTNPRLDQQWQSLDNDTQITLRERRADLFWLLGEPEVSINERIALQSLMLDPDQDDNNQDVLWQTLMTIPLGTLQRQSEQITDPLLKGWYSLALINKNNQSNLEKQLQQVSQWRNNWPQHPASVRLPKDLQLLQQLIEDSPAKVALLLPLQGRLSKAGRAIRDGFMAAYYQALANGSRAPELSFHDTSHGDILAHYQQAVDSGANLIIGPLDKGHVTELSLLDNLPVPTLAVNYSEDTAEPAQGLYQIGLSAEDEARQIAQRAWLEGHRFAMILTTDASWGTRSGTAFREAWEALGGKVIRENHFPTSGNYSNVIKSALHIDKSEQRYKNLRGLFNQSMEFEPRRRQDADMLFLVARPTQARQIKPTLAFHYASKLPVYATSHIYSGDPNPKADRDLNGIKFSTLPWFFDNTAPEKRSIEEAAKPAPSYQRLYALGVDSFQLYPRLKQLQQSPQTRLYGMTGALTMDSNRQIEREQVWAQMRRGKAQALPTLVQQ